MCEEAATTQRWKDGHRSLQHTWVEQHLPLFHSQLVSIVQKDQLNLQGVEILSLRESVHVEQQRYRQLWDDRETVVTRLHCQIRQLQQGRDDYYTKNQELQVGAPTSVQPCTHVHLSGTISSLKAAHTCKI